MPSPSTFPGPRKVERPIAAALAVVVHHGLVLLVRRANTPDAGLWGFPGGKIDPGERIEDAAVRELLEETGVHATADHVFTAVDAFDHDEGGALHRHFILLAVLCRWVSGNPRACDDALDARWFTLPELDAAHLATSFGVRDVAYQAHALMSDPRVRSANKT